MYFIIYAPRMVYLNYEPNKLCGYKKQNIADKKFSINSDTGVNESFILKAGVCGDIYMFVCLWINL